MNKLTLLKRKFIFCWVFLMATSITSSQIGIGTDTPDASAVLEIQSTSQGFLLPRMTETQMLAISTPVEGLMVYCTDCSPKDLYVYDGNAYTNIPGTASVTHTITGAGGAVWMDRNLGATQAATSSTDAAAYGDLYQWGRNTDGHEDRMSSTVSGPVTSGNEGSNFITAILTPFDWLTPQDDTRWNSGTEGSPIKTDKDPCPVGYRVPTPTDFQNEIDAIGGGSLYDSLKLTFAGERKNDGSLESVGSNGFYWTSSISPTLNHLALNLLYNSATALVGDGVYSSRSFGISIRCIKQ